MMWRHYHFKPAQGPQRQNPVLAQHIQMVVGHLLGCGAHLCEWALESRKKCPMDSMTLPPCYCKVLVPQRCPSLYISH